MRRSTTAASAAVIGHEMGHGFDDQGAKSDAHGVLRNWWQPADELAFKQRVDQLAAQYSPFEPLPGLKLNGRLTLGENIGDLGGLAVAYDAYHRSLHGEAGAGARRPVRRPALLPRLGAGVAHQAARRGPALAGHRNPHSPGKFRVNGVVRNVDAWYPAFKVQPGDKLYVPPDERVHIW